MLDHIWKENRTPLIVLIRALPFFFLLQYPSPKERCLMWRKRRSKWRRSSGSVRRQDARLRILCVSPAHQKGTSRFLTVWLDSDGVMCSDLTTENMMYPKGVQKMATRLDGTTYPAESTSATSALTTITEGECWRHRSESSRTLCSYYSHMVMMMMMIMKRK